MKLFKASTWIMATIISAIFFFLVYFMIPNHPKINGDLSESQIKINIVEIMANEAENIHRENIDSPTGGAPVEYMRALELFLKNLDICKNDKVCLITTYDNFMNQWVSNRLRVETKANFMIQKFGVAGEEFNNKFGFMY